MLDSYGRIAILAIRQEKLVNLSISMKIISVKLLALVFIVQMSGCAHYFSSAKTEQFSEDVRPMSICIDDGDVSVGEGPNRFTSKVRNDIKASVLEKINRKYPNVVNDCTATEKYSVIIRQEQEQVKGDYFFLSLGIIPIIAKTRSEVQVVKNAKPVYKATNEGKVVMSVFFIPFFFLHKSNAEVLFDMLDGFLQKQTTAKASN